MSMMKYEDNNMTEQKILIPKSVKYTKPLVCILHPKGLAEIEFTLKGEDTPFRYGKITRRSDEISAFMFRPKTIDEENRKFTIPLKIGDIVTVTVITNGTKVTESVEVT